MTDSNKDLAEKCMTQLRLAVQQAALPADEQLALLRGFDVTCELAEDFGHWCRWALASSEVNLPDAQRSCLGALNGRLEEMTFRGKSTLWTDEALRSSPEWEAVRRDAKEILELFQWLPEAKIVRIEQGRVISCRLEMPDEETR